jgi:hypothetical protein
MVNRVHQRRGKPRVSPNHPRKMKTFLQIAGLVIMPLYGCLVVWLYVHHPQSLSELKTQASVQANVYHVNQPNFDQAIKEFDGGDYNSAIGQFNLADPAERDSASQYYIAYSYYLLGRGRVFNDEDMFNKAIVAVNHCLDNAPNHIFQIDRTDVEIRDADALRQKLVEGLRHTPASLNPFNWFNKK